MTTGTVKWFNESKGYGFITPTDGSPDVFVHFSAIAGSGFKTLSEGQTVQFDIQSGDKDTQVHPIHRASDQNHLEYNGDIQPGGSTLFSGEHESRGNVIGPQHPVFLDRFMKLKVKSAGDVIKPGL